MVSCQNDKVFRPRRPKDVEVLKHRVRGPAIPCRLVEPLLRRQKIEKLVHFWTQERPTHLEVTQQAMRLVLAQDTYPANARVDAIRQREVDDAELAAEKHRRLSAPISQLLEPAAAPAGEHQRDGPLRESLLDASARQHFRVPSAVVGKDRRDRARANG